MFSAAANRLNNFVVGLTNVDPATSSPVLKSSYTVCAQYSGSVAAWDNATVVCSPSHEKFRFVIVQSSYTSSQALCITELAVYARSKQQSLRMLRGILGPILWGHSGSLCHVLSLSLSSSSWTSMRRRRACDSSDTW